MRVLVAMSGGVDSSVAAALLVDQGHEVEGATLKLWGGDSDSGCCSVGDVEDARRVAQQLGIVHHVFNMAEAFESSVVDDYVAAHRLGRTPNPCIECNRHVKFDRLLAKAARLGFDALATGHHARLDRSAGSVRLLRGADEAKDQSYVLSVLGQDQLRRVLFPVGELTKVQVREVARRLGLRTAEKADSQDVCFIRSDQGRESFLRDRLRFHAGSVVELDSGRQVGRSDALELVTVGQRRGMGHDDAGRRRYVGRVDLSARRVLVGTADQVACSSVDLLAEPFGWVREPLSPGAVVEAQVSAHGRPARARLRSGPSGWRVEFDEPQRPVAPGQTVALYDVDDPTEVRGAGIAA